MGADLNHYVARDEITRSIVEGVKVHARCGELVQCEHQGSDAITGNEVASRTLEVCADCEQIVTLIQQRNELLKEIRRIEQRAKDRRSSIENTDLLLEAGESR